jgi:hypothetical protein
MVLYMNGLCLYYLQLEHNTEPISVGCISYLGRNMKHNKNIYFFEFVFLNSIFTVLVLVI